MIIPVRCFTCHKVLGDKWNYFNNEVKKHEESDGKKKMTVKNLKIDDTKQTYFYETYKGQILNDLGLTKICCRRHMLGHVDLI
jgi:DNA-directed RNA polymerase subunit N